MLPTTSPNHSFLFFSLFLFYFTKLCPSRCDLIHKLWFGITTSETASIKQCRPHHANDFCPSVYLWHDKAYYIQDGFWQSLCSTTSRYLRGTGLLILVDKYHHLHRVPMIWDTRLTRKPACTIDLSGPRSPPTRIVSRSCTLILRTKKI